MPSFDVVSEVTLHEVNNAVDQANREVQNRFDFKGTGSTYTWNDPEIQMVSETEFQLRQMLEILKSKLAKRKIDLGALEANPVEESGKQARQTIVVRQGIETEIAKKIVKLVKDQRMKVQSAIQGEKVRVTGKKRDDLQKVIALLKESELGLPLQFTNFRD